MSRGGIPYEPMAWRPLQRALTSYFGRPQHRPGGPCACSGVQNLAFGGECWTLREAAELLGFERQTVAGWATKGSLPAINCDEIAVTLSLMPWMIWSEWPEWADRWANRGDEKHHRRLALQAASARRLRAERREANRRHLALVGADQEATG